MSMFQDVEKTFIDTLGQLVLSGFTMESEYRRGWFDGYARAWTQLTGKPWPQLVTAVNAALKGSGKELKP